MSLKIISYDLGKPETSADYKDLIEYVKSLGSWAKPLESFWIVDSPKYCSTIRDEAQEYLDSNDEILVVSCPFESWASWGLDKDVTSWIKARS
jgi:hypothetical protein